MPQPQKKFYLIKKKIVCSQMPQPAGLHGAGREGEEDVPRGRHPLHHHPARVRGGVCSGVFIGDSTTIQPEFVEVCVVVYLVV